MKFHFNGLLAGLTIGAVLGAGATALSQSAVSSAALNPPSPMLMAARVLGLQPPAIQWRWPDNLQAEISAPKNHKILYEDDHVKVIEVTIRPGDKEVLHGHMNPSVFAIDALQPKGDNTQVDGTVLDVKRSLADLKLPTCAAIGPQAPHQFHNTDTFAQHFYRVEFKRVDGDGILTRKYG